MGLEDFHTEDDNNGSEDTDKQNEKTTSENEASGLDSFRTPGTRGGSGEESSSDGKDSTIYGVQPRKWSAMSVKERVKHVRQTHIPDYYPEIQPDDRWSYADTITIDCVCGNKFTFVQCGLCLGCSRGYEDVGRTVAKKHDPYKENSDKEN
jgi:hypothetical protein